VKKQDLQALLKDASELALELPTHLQEKGFEIAVGLLGGNAHARNAGSQGTTGNQSSVDQTATNGEPPALSDLLKICKNNHDRLVVFLRDLEAKGQEATVGGILGLFLTYQQDRPKNVQRDLRDMTAKDWVEQLAKERGSPWLLMRKGRERHDELTKQLDAK
jgi:hypothetical protein